MLYITSYAGTLFSSQERKRQDRNFGSTKMFESVFGRSFNPVKCKTLLRLLTSRIKLLKNKRDIQLKQMKRELVQLLQTNQESSARIRVEHIYREQNIMAAYEIVELFSELIIVRLPIIDSQRQCPIDLREAVASLIFAAPRCADLPELQQIRNLFGVKYGKEFVAAAAELRPDCGVNRLVIEKLSVRAPSGEVKLNLMKAIAAEQSVDWDSTASESELLKPPEDLLEGPTWFLGASQMSLQTPSEEPSTKEPIAQQNQGSVVAESKTTAFQTPEISLDEKQFIPFVLPVVGDNISPLRSQSTSKTVNSQSQRGSRDQLSPPTFDYKHDGDDDVQPVVDRKESFKDVATAAKAAAESAERAAAAARAAALLASKKFNSSTAGSSSDSDGDDDGDKASQPQAGPTDKYLKLQKNPFDDNLTNEKPIFDEPVEGEGSHSAHRIPTRKQTSWKEYFNEYDSTTELVSPSKFRTGKYDDDHVGQQQLDNRKYSSNNWHFQHDDLKSQSISTGSSESSGAAPHFDTYQSDITVNKPEDVAPCPTTPGPSEPPPPKIPAVEQPTLLKTASKGSHVHPKLPDYDDLAAHFRALRSTKR